MLFLFLFVHIELISPVFICMSVCMSVLCLSFDLKHVTFPFSPRAAASLSARRGCFMRSTNIPLNPLFFGRRKKSRALYALLSAQPVPKSRQSFSLVLMNFPLPIHFQPPSSH